MSKFKKVMGIVGKVFVCVIAAGVGACALAGIVAAAGVAAESEATGRSTDEIVARNTKYLYVKK